MPAVSGASGEPVVFPDGFTADGTALHPRQRDPYRMQLERREHSGSVDIWVGFTNGTKQRRGRALLVAPDGSTVDVDRPADIDCGSRCNGWTFSHSTG
jgi:hypothetical protein